MDLPAGSIRVRGTALLRSRVFRADSKNWYAFCDNLTIEDNARFQIVDFDSSRSDFVPTRLNGKAEPQGHPVSADDTAYHQFQNTLTAEKWISERTLVSGGYMFLKQSGDAQYDMAYTSENAPGEPVAYSSHAKFYAVDSSDLDQISHIASANSLMLLSEDLVLTVGVQAEFTENETLLEDNLRHGNPPSDHIVEVDTDIDAVVLRENIEARYLGIDGMTVYARGDLVQDQYDLFEQTLDHRGVQELRRDTEADITRARGRVGVTAAPAGLKLSAYYQYEDRDADYTHNIDEEERGDEGDGYSGHIYGLESEGNEFVVKASKRLAKGASVSQRERASP
ncbi:MAG: hypothetical protein O2923_05165 [Verrucomicrobia bacterium]|nr:hypothetical protein [Verrucomicrobiota bacterium]